MKNTVSIIGQVVQDEIYTNNKKSFSIGGTAYFSTAIYSLLNLKTIIYTSTSSKIKNNFQKFLKKKIKFNNIRSKKPTTFRIFYSRKSLDVRKFSVDFNENPVSYKIKKN